MKKIYFSILFLLATLASFAQADSTQVENAIAQTAAEVVSKAKADSAYINKVTYSFNCCSKNFLC